MSTKIYVKIENEWGIVAARQAGRQLTKDIGFDSVDQARITTAISELARNIYLYAKVGDIYIEKIETDKGIGIKITAMDNGPGIENVRYALEGSLTKSGALGAGLPGVRRLMDDFEIDTETNKGTVITIVKWLVD